MPGEWIQTNKTVLLLLLPQEIDRVTTYLSVIGWKVFRLRHCEAKPKQSHSSSGQRR
ncbi:protein of unknown function [Candidatus Methylomirabilis oxygeniifera]|uniref:Uncharacterized protein n=1 Tax=Methylomirabilis oxygeniifera TaxID=671143 RepID=D5MF46_METO1|nr:protein of unknown function [Candidatus Methylomirabilis oxyfera]